MPNPNEPQNTLRDVLSAKFDASETPAIETPVIEAEPQGETAEQRADRLRDDKGRFARAEGVEAPEPSKPAPTTAPAATKAPVAQPEPLAPAAPVATAPKLTTWRREFLPIQDKLASGAALTPDEAKKLADYNVQREKEYATGVATYKAEAQNAKELQDALTPFMADLQANNIKPSQWIYNLGNAHATLVKGNPQQKIQMFAQLAQQYGVPLGAVATPEGNLDPIVPQLMQHIQDLTSRVNTVAGWRDQQEQQSLQREISKFEDAAKFPHFEAVRGDMAQLLESGVAKNLDEAYERAIYMNPETRQAEFERQAQTRVEQLAQAKLNETKVAAAQAAKTRAVSTKTTTPSGAAVVATGPKDRRSSIEEKFDAMEGRRV